MNDSKSFAHDHHRPTGFRAFPRWLWRDKAFWKRLSGEHRAILFELYQQIAGIPTTHKGYGIPLQRGQWATTAKRLARDAGFPKGRQRARSLLTKAEAAGIISTRTSAAMIDGSTCRFTLITWIDFEAYDQPQEWPSQSLNQSVNHPGNQSPNQNKTRSGDTELEDTPSKTREEEGAAGAASTPRRSPSTGQQNHRRELTNRTSTRLPRLAGPHAPHRVLDLDARVDRRLW